MRIENPAGNFTTRFCLKAPWHVNDLFCALRLTRFLITVPGEAITNFTCVRY